ncbi:MAG: FAD/NAD(P)-binding protein [Gemmatimonas sp.]
MNKFRSLAIIGIGPSALYLLQQLEREIDRFRPTLTDIYLFEQRAKLGVGMPYDRNTTDLHNLCNISSAEIPALHESLVDWLHSLSDAELSEQGIRREDIDADETYRRTTLGDYFHQQYLAVARTLRSRGLTLHEFSDCAIDDVTDDPDAGTVAIRLSSGESFVVDRLVVATGHNFLEPDDPINGYFASPWPMQKLIPPHGQLYNFDIGILGASLSAFDVVSSLSHRHGTFSRDGKGLRYDAFPETENFRIVLHSAEGWLPHLQYEQAEPFRVVYRHVDRDTLLALRDPQGFMSLDEYFDKVCRPALVAAFTKDKRPDIAALIANRGTTLETFVQTMSDEHTADDPFALMRVEMSDAKRSLRKGVPIHWKETLDDLMFTLNFHFNWLPAEDHLRYRRTLMPFLMNVIAAMPLHSANIMLALHEAGRLELIAGRVSVTEKDGGVTRISVDSDGKTTSRAYRMFINCSGQGGVALDHYPFQSLKEDGAISEATVPLREDATRAELAEAEPDKLTDEGVGSQLRAGGISIDGYYRVRGRDGASNERIHDIAFPHATGLRPYSYGLQACDATAAIVVQSWCAECDRGLPASADDRVVTQTYEQISE